MVFYFIFLRQLSGWSIMNAHRNLVEVVTLQLFMDRKSVDSVMFLDFITVGALNH